MKDSDLIGAELAAALGFLGGAGVFFVGPVVGIIAILLGVGFLRMVANQDDRKVRARLRWFRRHPEPG